METATKKPLTTFILGKLCITPAAWERVEESALFECFVRHLTGDWGDVDEFDWKSNDDAFEYGGRILSAYTDKNQLRFWIITEADRSATTIFLPEEY